MDPQEPGRWNRVDPINGRTEGHINLSTSRALELETIAFGSHQSLSNNHHCIPMAPCTGKEADFPKSKCTAVKLKQMYENRVLLHRLSSGYRPGGDVPTPR